MCKNKNYCDGRCVVPKPYLVLQEPELRDTRGVPVVELTAGDSFSHGRWADAYVSSTGRKRFAVLTRSRGASPVYSTADQLWSKR